MELTIPKQELSKLLHLTATIAEKKATMPILANVLLEATKGTFRITGSDGELVAVASTPASVTAQGAITVGAKVLAELVRELPDQDVTIRTSEGARVEVMAGKTRLKILGVSPEEYPAQKGLELAAKSKVSAAMLAEMINRTLYAVSLDEGRYNLGGACLELCKEGKSHFLRMSATDGHRLAVVSRPVDPVTLSSLESTELSAGALGPHVIIPRKGLMEIRKALEVVGDGNVGIDVSNGFLVVEFPGCKLVVRLLDAEFPDYQRVIPKVSGAKVIALSNSLAHALRRMSLVVSDKGKGVRMDVFPNLMRISSSSPELGEGQEELEVQFDGANFSVGFNSKYLLDVISSMGENQPLVIEMSKDMGAGKFYNESDESSYAVVMPIRLPGL
jgi:DNA polymerase-3 subunit beta